MTIEFYYTDGSIPCRFIQLLAKNYNIQFNPIRLDLVGKKDQLKADFLKINPQHCVPTIVDNGFTLWESSVIATYLIQKYTEDTTLYPKELDKRALIDQRLFFNVSILLQRHRECFFQVLMGIGVPTPEKLKRLEAAFEMLEAMLEKHEYMAGDNLTVADYAISTTVSTSVAAGFKLAPYKAVEKWFNKIKTTVPSFEEFNGSEVILKIFEGHRKLL